LSILSIVLIFSSCRNSQDLVYMNNLQHNEYLPAANDTLTRYILQPGDILYVSIKSMSAEVNAMLNPEESMERQQSSLSSQKYTTPQGAYLYGYEISEAGQINLPILGNIAIAGHTQLEAQQIIQQQADQYLKEAVVKAKLLNYKVTVMGEVNHPGVYYNYSNNFTLPEAIALANGNTNFANIKKVLVIRANPEGNKAIRLDLTDKASWASEAFYMKPNDYVFVEPATNKNLQLNGQAYSMILSSVSVLLAVFGFLR